MSDDLPDTVEELLAMPADHPDIMANHGQATRYASQAGMTHVEAMKLTADYSQMDKMALATRAYERPGSLSAHEYRLLQAFVLVQNNPLQ
jgi:hypothetical protein